MTVHDLLPDYLEYLSKERNRSVNTLRNYGAYLTHFAGAMEGRDLDKITQQDISDYARALRLHVGVNTLALYMIAIRQFFKYAAAKRDQACLSYDEITVPDTVLPRVVYLRPDEVAQLYNAAETDEHRLLIAFLFESGLRISEFANLTREAVDLGECVGDVVGKGKKQRTFFFGETSQRLLAKRFKKHRTTTDLSVRQLERIVKALAKKAGIEKPVTPHKLRHSFATNLMKTSMPLREIQVLMGHSSSLTTERYTHVDDPSLRDSYRNRKDAFFKADVYGNLPEYQPRAKRPKFDLTTGEILKILASP